MTSYPDKLNKIEKEGKPEKSISLGKLNVKQKNRYNKPAILLLNKFNEKLRKTIGFGEFVGWRTLAHFSDFI